MAELLTGVQGSGKSYNAMHRIYTGKENYYKVYSNVDQLKNTANIHSLDFNSFVTYALNECYRIMVTANQGFDADYTLSPTQIFDLITTQSVTYDDAIEYLQSIKILPTVVDEHNRVLLIIDEAQDYFGKTVKLSSQLLWFITQHRHLYMEVILLTQDHSLIRSDYKLFNAVYDAVPPTKQFDKNFFTYHHYAGLPLNEANYVGKIKLKKDKNIFSLYKSGDKVVSPNILKRFIYMGISAVLLIIVSLYFLTDMFSGKVETASKNSTVKLISETNATLITHNSTSNYSNLTYIKLNCIADICKNRIFKINLNIDDLNATVSNTQSKILNVKKYSDVMGVVTLLATKDFLNLFSGANNENQKTQGFSLIN